MTDQSCFVYDYVKCGFIQDCHGAFCHQPWTISMRHSIRVTDRNRIIRLGIFLFVHIFCRALDLHSFILDVMCVFWCTITYEYIYEYIGVVRACGHTYAYHIHVRQWGSLMQKRRRSTETSRQQDIAMAGTHITYQQAVSDNPPTREQLSE